MTDKISAADQSNAQNTDKKEDKPLDPVAVLTLDLLDQAGKGGTLTPIDVAKAFAEPRRKANDPVDLWRRYLPAANQQARFLARQGKINILRRGEPVDPHKPIKGLIKLALPQA
ncbi:DUF3253 domain-containing protein [Rhodovibrionaceae bacterium A322]